MSCVQNLHENRPSLRGRAAASIEPKMSDVTASVNYSKFACKKLYTRGYKFINKPELISTRPSTFKGFRV